MRLLVDIGNSRVKWALARAGAIADGPYAFPRPDDAPDAAFAVAWGALQPPAAVAACAVAGQGAAALAAWTRAQWQLEPFELRARARAGALVSGYRDPEALGADRWANLLGVRALLGAVDAIVVDAGTAVTVDALHGDGRHAGGAIVAGLDAGRAALRAAAPALPLPADDAALPADTPGGAIGAGTLVGLAGAIERLAAEVGAGLDRPRRLLTGGDAGRLAPLLGPDWTPEPLLTLRGVLAAAEDACAG